MPASALRFRPELLGMNGEQEPAQGGPEGARTSGERPGGDKFRGSHRTAHVYLPPAKAGGMLKAVDFVPGLTDGQYIEVRKGDITEGQKIVVGLATSQGQDLGGLAGMARGGRH